MATSKKIIVTGGAGFIGSHTVVALIENGYRPIIIDDFSNSSPGVIDRLERITGKKITHYTADCKDRDLMRNVIRKEGDIEGVIHFAAFKSVSESVERPKAYYDNNIGSLETMLSLAEEFDIPKFVFSSSCTVYGETRTLPVTETTPMLKAESPYGETKQIGEKMMRKRRPSGAVILRYFNPVGAHPSGLIGESPNGRPENLIPFITQVAAGIREKLSVFGSDYDTEDGTCIRDYIHVMDLAEAHVAAIKRLDLEPKSDIFNIGTGTGNSVLQAIEWFESINDVKLNYEITDRRPGDIMQIWADTTKATQVLNWVPRYTLSDALRHAWIWQQSQGELQLN